MNTVHSKDGTTIALDQSGVEPTVSIATKMLWAGRIISAFAVLFLIFDGVIKVL